MMILGPRRTMDSIRVSEAPDSGSIPDEATILIKNAIMDIGRFTSCYCPCINCTE